LRDQVAAAFLGLVPYYGFTTTSTTMPIISRSLDFPILA
jgi:hypothetical protein